MEEMNIVILWVLPLGPQRKTHTSKHFSHLDLHHRLEYVSVSTTSFDSKSVLCSPVYCCCLIQG